MNNKEKRSYNNLNDAKKKIKNAKINNEDSIRHIKNLMTFIEENIRVNNVNKIRDDAMQYIDKMNANDRNLNLLISRLNMQQAKIKEISKLREEAEKFGN